MVMDIWTPLYSQLEKVKLMKNTRGLEGEMCLNASIFGL